ncbi:MAG: ThiF family adenylyltransferase [Candidatus Berkelbacteria bacterium]|nr:ThiF family adenylyltransferase [Candidatus Berkelbacteria bacterium]
MKTKKTKSSMSPEWKPRFISYSKVQSLLLGYKVVDTYKAQLRELFAINNPALFHSRDFEKLWQKYLADTIALKPLHETGTWVFYSWSNTIVHVLPEENFFRVRTARNRNLIITEEQKGFYDAVVGIAGLSIGMSVALALVLAGGAKRLKLADPDTIELSNLNRIPVGIGNLGLPKVVAAARLIYELNPYAEVEIFSDGITSKNIADFFGGEHPLTVAVDEMDNLSAKAELRVVASAKCVPVVMSADCDTNSVLDVERFDLDRNLPQFHGRLGNNTALSLAGLSKKETGELIRQHVGAENHTERMNASLAEIGHELVSWPQLGGTALQNGVAVAHIIRQIVTGQPVTDSRAVIALSELLSRKTGTKTKRTR